MTTLVARATLGMTNAAGETDYGIHFYMLMPGAEPKWHASLGIQAVEAAYDAQCTQAGAPSTILFVGADSIDLLVEAHEVEDVIRTFVEMQLAEIDDIDLDQDVDPNDVRREIDELEIDLGPDLDGDARVPAA